MNASFSNSNVNATVNSVHVAQVSYPEGQSTSSAVNALVGRTDGQMDGVHALRNQYGADVVVLIAETFLSGQFGRVQDGAIPANSSNAFAVVRRDAAVPDFSYAHEVGHLLGGRHNNDPDQSIPYSHAYRYDPGDWRTILAQRSGTPTNRINYWSNPDVTFGGVAMGTASQNDVARVWDERASTVAGFRPPPPPFPPPSGLTVTNFFQTGPAPELAWTPPSNPDTPVTQYKVYRDVQSESNGDVLAGTTTGTTFTDHGYQSATYATGNDEIIYYVRAVYSGGTSAFSNGAYTVIYNPNGGYGASQGALASLAAERPAPEFGLATSAPNPTSTTTTVRFSTAEGGPVSLVIFDALGREVLRPVDGFVPAGTHDVAVDVSTLSPGAYFLRLVAGTDSASGSLSVAR